MTTWEGMGDLVEDIPTHTHIDTSQTIKPGIGPHRQPERHPPHPQLRAAGCTRITTPYTGAIFGT